MEGALREQVGTTQIAVYDERIETLLVLERDGGSHAGSTRERQTKAQAGRCIWAP